MATERDTVKDALEAFTTFADQENEQRGLMLEDYRFRGGQQWPEALRLKRENDPHGPRPCLTLDRTNQHVRQVVNDGRMNRPGMRVRPVDDRADPRTARMLNGLIRHIESKPTSRADIAYDWALECAATAGLGWFRIATEVTGRNGEQEPKIMRVANPLSVYVGTDWSEPDGCDIECCLVTEDMARKKYDRVYGKKHRNGKRMYNPCDWKDATGDEKEWINRDSVRIAEYMMLVTLEEGEAEYEQYARFSYGGPVKVVRWYKLSAKEILEETTFPAGYIPVIPVIGQEIWEGNKRILVGMVRPAMDAQRSYNLANSNTFEHVSLSPRAKWLVADGQIDGYEDEWRNAHASSNPVLMYKAQVDGQQVQPPSRIFGPEVPQGLVAVMQASERDLQAAMGQYGPSLGAPSNERSGIAIREKKSEGDRGNFHYVDNLSRSVRHGCTITLQMIPRLYDTPRIARILGEDGRDAMAEINPAQETSYGRFEQADGAVRQVYNPGVGVYDVVAASGPAYPTLRSESAAAMIQIVQANPGILQTHGDLIFKAQDWPDAEQFAKRFRMLLPPQILEQEAAEDQGNPMDPEAVAAILQKEKQIQQLTAQMQAMQQAMQQLQAKAQATSAQEMKAQTDAMQAQIEAQNSQIEAFRAETERMKAEAEIQAKNAQTIATVQGMRNEAQESESEARAQAAMVQALSDLGATLSESQRMLAGHLAQMSQMMCEKRDHREVTTKTGKAKKLADGSWSLVVEEVEAPEPGEMH